MSTNTPDEILWPNQQTPLEGLVPSSEISQDPDLFCSDIVNPEEVD